MHRCPPRSPARSRPWCCRAPRKGHSRRGRRRRTRGHAACPDGFQQGPDRLPAVLRFLDQLGPGLRCVAEPDQIQRHCDPPLSEATADLPAPATRLQRSLANASGRRGRASSVDRAGDDRRWVWAASVLAGVPSTCPKQRSATVANGQQRSSAGVTDLRHRRTASSPTVLPKLAVARRPGPCWVRTASGTADPPRARAVNVGESASQVRGRPPSRPWTAKQPGAGFESHLLHLLLSCLPWSEWMPPHQ
jgi:hypothetical protein